MASIDRTAYPRFKRVVSVRELTEAFTLTKDEIEWASGRTHTEQHLLALAVLLKSYQRLGYFPKLAEVPAVVVDHVRAVLGLGEHVAAEHESERTLWRHRDFVRGWACGTSRRSLGGWPRRRSGPRWRRRTTRLI